MFQTFLEQIGEANIQDPDETDRHVKAICKRNAINGRQIRNIISFAQALATVERKKLSAAHLEYVYETTVDFLECLKDLTRECRGCNDVLWFKIRVLFLAFDQQSNRKETSSHRDVRSHFLCLASTSIQSFRHINVAELQPTIFRYMHQIGVT